MTFRRSPKLGQFQGSSCIMVSPRIGDISLLLDVLDAVSTVNFRPLEPHFLTVSGAPHFEDPEESYFDGNHAEITDDEDCPPTETHLRVLIRESSIKLWVYNYVHAHTIKSHPLLFASLCVPCAGRSIGYTLQASMFLEVGEAGLRLIFTVNQIRIRRAPVTSTHTYIRAIWNV